jgi:hypothetical protein
MNETPQLTYAALAATLELSRLRSQIIVATMLATQFPTEDAWWGLVSDPEYVECLNALAEVIADIRSDAAVAEGTTPESVAEAAERHHDRALEAIQIVAERLQVPTEDLLNVLISS